MKGRKPLVFNSSFRIPHSSFIANPCDFHYHGRVVMPRHRVRELARDGHGSFPPDEFSVERVLLPGQD
jgi:hypothetical protein